MAREQPKAARPIHDAARTNDVGWLKDLLAAGEDVNVRDADDRTPLHHAADFGAPRTTKLLIEHGAEIAHEPADMPYGVREYGVRDPEGGLWSFMQPTEERHG